jgi:FtsP/CotA-like multicopper oxidase with cupredoxin domain
MSRIYLPWNASKARLRDAENARRNRAEIVRELSWGRVSRRDLIKMGLFTGAGVLAPIGGLNPFATSVSAATAGPTGAPPSPLFGVQPFTQPLLRFDVLPRNAPSCLSPTPTKASNQTMQPVPEILGGGMGPVEGRPPGPVWAHQGFERHAPAIAIEAWQSPGTANYRYNPQVASSQNSGINPADGLPVRFHPKWPTQSPNSVWTFNGTIPPKLVIGRYGEPLLFRHHNRLPADVRQNNGFGRHTLTTHEHNGHHGAENDGFTGAFFFPNQFYDYHWPIVLGGCFSHNAEASDAMACSPMDDGGTMKVPGDWRETMSTHWFHDHMFGFTAQNVYKGNVAMFNIYSGLDRGAEDVDDGINLRLPSGNSTVTGKKWGNLDYDVNLMLSDKAFDREGQLFFDIFEFDGFMGDVMTVNLAYKPYMEVEPRKYRFRILNACMSRFIKVALTDALGAAVPVHIIASDGNLMPQPVLVSQLDQQGTAERFDIIVDFSTFNGQKLHLVNLADHFDPEDSELNGRKVIRDLSVAAALSGTSQDPCVGRIMEFRVVRPLTAPDVSRIPTTMIPNPDLSSIPVARERRFIFGRDGIQPNIDPSTREPIFSAGVGPWGTRTEGGPMLNADFGRISGLPRYGSREIWHLINDGGGWDHPVHIHFEEGQILARDGQASRVPPWERGRKDTYRLRPGGSITITMQFRDWGGMFMEHCHNTMHEDNAMLLRWDLNTDGEPFLAPLPTPSPTPQGVTFHDPTYE